jgi:hypothetical protein
MLKSLGGWTSHWWWTGLNVSVKSPPEALQNLNSMLVSDSYWGHTTAKEKMLKNSKTELAIISGGLTPLLQPLDVCINRPFNAALKEMYTIWIADGKREYMPTGKIKLLNNDLVCTWIKDVWECVSPSSVDNEFQKVQHLK